jgi:hypothetical protein
MFWFTFPQRSGEKSFGLLDFKNFMSISTVFRPWLTYKGLFRIIMVNPESFQGTRKEFLLGEKAAEMLAA